MYIIVYCTPWTETMYAVHNLENKLRNKLGQQLARWLIQWIRFYNNHLQSQLIILGLLEVSNVNSDWQLKTE